MISDVLTAIIIRCGIFREVMAILVIYPASRALWQSWQKARRNKAG